VRTLADCVQRESAHQSFEFVVALPARRPNLQPFRLGCVRRHHSDLDQFNHDYDNITAD